MAEFVDVSIQADGPNTEGIAEEILEFFRRRARPITLRIFLTTNEENAPGAAEDVHYGTLFMENKIVADFIWGEAYAPDRDGAGDTPEGSDSVSTASGVQLPGREHHSPAGAGDEGDVEREPGEDLQPGDVDAGALPGNVHEGAAHQQDGDAESAGGVGHAGVESQADTRFPLRGGVRSPD